MKNQETVERNFAKVRKLWEESRDSKVKNIDKQTSEIRDKITALQSHISQLETRKGELLSDPGPKAPTVEDRKKKKEQDQKNDSSNYDPARMM